MCCAKARLSYDYNAFAIITVIIPHPNRKRKFVFCLFSLWFFFSHQIFDLDTTPRRQNVYFRFPSCSLSISRWLLLFIQSIHSISSSCVLCYFLRAPRVESYVSGFECACVCVCTKLDCQLSWWMWWRAARGHATVCQHCHTVPHSASG